MYKLARILFSLLPFMICTVAAAQTAQSAKEAGTTSSRVMVAGKGVPHVTVKLYNSGQMRSGPIQTSTDLDGRFTFNNLDAGANTVMAFSGSYVAPSDQKGMSLGKAVAVGGTNSSVGQATPAFYMRTYYPDAEQSQAKVVDVAEGGEVTGTDINVIRPQKKYTATGRVVDEATGKPASGMRVVTRIVTADGKQQISIGPFAIADARGIFRLEGLEPGHYRVLTVGDQNQGIEESGQFEITDKDLSGIELKHTRGLTLTGQVVLGTDDSQARAQLGRLQFQGYVVGSQPVRPLPYIDLNPDGSFSVAGVTPGVLNLSLVPEVSKNFSILQIERNGVPQAGPVNIAPGENVSLKVILGYGTGTVRGQFKVKNGELPQGAQVTATLFVFGKPATIRSVVADERGRFLFEGLASGEYEVAVQVQVPSTRAGLFGDVVKERISVRSGSESQVTLTLDVSKIKKPDGGAAGN